jgi:hypothetical protein
MEKEFRVPLEGMSNHQIAVGHTIRIVDITPVPVVSFHNVRFHRIVAVFTKMSFYWWWFDVIQNVNFSSVLPN